MYGGKERSIPFPKQSCNIVCMVLLWSRVNESVDTSATLALRWTLLVLLNAINWCKSGMEMWWWRNALNRVVGAIVMVLLADVVVSKGKRVPMVRWIVRRTSLFVQR